MKRGLLKIWLYLIVFYQTEIHELIYLPLLVQHYFETVQTKPQTHFLDFIVDHYFDCTHQDPVKHSQLPFQTTHTYPPSLLNLSTFDLIIFNLDKLFRIPIYLEISFQGDFSNSIWQPPRLMKLTI